jgi:hypothetical protein
VHVAHGKPPAHLILDLLQLSQAMAFRREGCICTSGGVSTGASAEGFFAPSAGEAKGVGAPLGSCKHADFRKFPSAGQVMVKICGQKIQRSNRCGLNRNLFSSGMAAGGRGCL